MSQPRMANTLRLLVCFGVLFSMLPAALAVPQPVLAQSETPRTITTREVTSFSVPSPGLFYQESSLCPGGVDPKAAASPAAMEAASPFAVWRNTVRDEDERALQFIIDPSVGDACDPHPIYSNIVADANFVYWVDETGLVKLPVTANVGDAPTLMNGAYAFGSYVELYDNGDYLIAVSNLPVQNNGPIGPTGGSYVEKVDKVTGEYDVLYSAGTFQFPENKYFRDVKGDGRYIYFRDKDQTLVRLDPSVDPATVNSIAADVSAYFPAGDVSFCFQLTCETHNYVYYAQNNTIRKREFEGGIDTDEPVINLPAGAKVRSITASTFLGLTTLFYFQETYESFGGFSGRYTYSLHRSGSFFGTTPELLYFYMDDNATPPDAPSYLTTDGTWLFWLESDGIGGTLKRLPNDVDALPKVDMTITGVEITQGVQKNDNTVRLVQGRETYVRVFVKSLDPVVDIQGATMRLYATYGGSERGPYRPINGTHLTAKVTPDRNQINDSFLFVLPWDASNSADVSLRAVLNPYQVPAEPNYGNNEWISPAYAFSPGRSIDLIFVEANYCIQKSLNDCPIYQVNDTGVHADYLRRAYPIPEGGINYRVWTINGGAALGNHVMQLAKVCQDMPADSRSLCASDWVNAKIGTMRANAGNSINASTLTYGLITDSSSTGGAFPRGQAGTDRIGSGPAGSSIISGTASFSYSNYGYYTGHEIGHMYGRQHPVPNSDDPATDKDAKGNPLVEGCGHSRDDAGYPYNLARIGPGDGSIRGFDRAMPYSGGYPRPRVLDDVNSFDMMTYCGDANLRWPSDYTWEGLYQGIINTPAAMASSVALEGDFLSVFGVIYGTTPIVHSVARLSSVNEKTPGDAGAWRLRLLDEQGTELAAYLFDADEGEGDGGQAFGVVVDFAPGTRTYEIVEVASGETRFSAPVSANVPTVSDVALQNASSPVTGTVTLAWTAADVDGDTLTYDVFYSVDGGASYQPVALGVSETSTPVDTSKLAGGQGRFRVYANDGVNQGQGDSPDYTMAVKSPQVTIVRPADGERFVWNELVNFSGEALDAQDGLITGSSLTWSNQNGTLGNGGQISIDNLPVGPNVITLSAQNSAGETSSKQITIYVDDPLDLPGPMLAVAPTGLSFQVAAGATDAVSSTLSLANTGGDSLTWSATSSETWLTLSAASGDVPGIVTVTADPSGLQSNMLHQATLTFTGVAAGYADQVVVVPVGLSIGNSFVNPNGTTPDSPEEPGTQLFMPKLAH